MTVKTITFKGLFADLKMHEFVKRVEGYEVIRAYGPVGTAAREIVINYISKVSEK